jgi:5-methylthioadenosine/S-adenosylhomocysteine deaminase
MQQVDTIIHARWVIPVEPAGVVLDDHSLVIHDGRIEAIRPSNTVLEHYQATTEHHLPNHALIPGLINAHTHAPMNLMRGLADDLPLKEWLEQHIWPAEAKWVSEHFVHDSTQLAVAEMLRSGTTCFNDMYFFPDVTARVALNAGIRAMIGLIVIDFPTIWAQDADEYIGKALDLHDQIKGEAMLGCCFAPHAPYTVSDQPLSRIRTLAYELGLPIHMHVHETAGEVQLAESETGLRPLARLDELGLLSPDFLAVHMTQLTDADIALVADRGVRVIHCPESNLKLASGLCPVHKLQQNGVSVALGTDGVASNDDLDMVGEMRTAALIAKVTADDASALPAHAALRMATLSGAEALGLGEITGSLETGKAADVVAIDLGRLETQPLYNPISQIVYSANRDQISDVWVAGRHLLKNRQLTTLDEDELIAKARLWRDKIAQ